MKVLAIDVGKGTQDILLYDSTQRTENCIKMVLPSQTQIIAQRIMQATAKGSNILLTGTTMGGGPSGRAVHNHLQAGLKVFATKKAALTLHDNLEKVASMGVTLIEDHEIDAFNARQIVMCDIEVDALSSAFDLFDTQIPQDFAIAVQDHGESPDMSNRIFRFDHFRKVLEEGGEFRRFAYLNHVPPHLTRMRSVMQTLNNGSNNVLIMDTGPAAICGALADVTDYPVVIVNVGNGHTLAAVVSQHRILALFEHHTRQMDVVKLDDYIRRLCDGKLTFNEVFDDGGHGCHIKKAVGSTNIRSVIVTGPNRQIMEGSDLDIFFAAPHGDMMLTGCFGLIDMFITSLSSRSPDT